MCDDLSKVSPQVLDEAPVEAVYAKVMFFRNVETPVNKTFNISIKLPTKNLKQLDEFKLELKMKHSGQIKQKESLSRFTDLYNNYRARKSPSEEDENDRCEEQLIRHDAIVGDDALERFDSEPKLEKIRNSRRGSYFRGGDSTPVASSDASPMSKKGRINSLGGP